MDDILIHGTCIEEHDANLNKFLARTREVVFKLNRQKCKFGVNQVAYIGYILTSEGIKPDPKIIQAIVDIPNPDDVPALQHFLEMVTYCANSFLTSVQKKIHCVNYWRRTLSWLDLNNGKLHSNGSRTWSRAHHFSSNLTRRNLSHTADASKDGLVAACLQKGQSVAYASHVMTWITVETEHKPLVSLWKKPLHVAPIRLQKMLLKLQKCDIDLVY